MNPEGKRSPRKVAEDVVAALADQLKSAKPEILSAWNQRKSDVKDSLTDLLEHGGSALDIELLVATSESTIEECLIFLSAMRTRCLRRAAYVRSARRWRRVGLDLLKSVGSVLSGAAISAISRGLA